MKESYVSYVMLQMLLSSVFKTFFHENIILLACYVVLRILHKYLELVIPLFLLPNINAYSDNRGTLTLTKRFSIRK
jgi:hypothetical protein